MTARNDDVLLGRIAVERGFLEPAQVEWAFKLQESGTPGRLGEILVQQGLLAPAQLVELLHIQRGKLDHIEHVRFGKIALRKGYVTREQLLKGLQAQSESLAYPEFLGVILVQQGVLTPAQVEEILKEIPTRAERVRRARRMSKMELRREFSSRRTASWAVGVLGAAVAMVLVFGGVKIILKSVNKKEPPLRTARAVPEPAVEEAPPAAPTTPPAPPPRVEKPASPFPPEEISPLESVIGPPPKRPPREPDRVEEIVLPPAGAGAGTRPKVADPSFLIPQSPADEEAEREVYAAVRRYAREIQPLPKGEKREEAFGEVQRTLENCAERHMKAGSRYALLWGMAALYNKAINSKREGHAYEAAILLQKMVLSYPEPLRKGMDSPLGNGALLPGWLGLNRSLATTCQYSLNDADWAHRSWREIAQSFPLTTEADVARDYLGVYWEERGEYDRAIAFYQQVVSIKKEITDPWVAACRRKKDKSAELADLVRQIEKGEYTRALVALQSDFARDPLEGEPVFWSGVAYLGMGARQEAGVKFREYLEKKPNGPFAARARRHLKDLGEEPRR